MDVKRTRYSNDFKNKIIEETLKTGNKSEIARKYVLSVSVIHRWLNEYRKHTNNKNKMDEEKYV